MENEEKKIGQAQQLQALLRAPVPRFYANGVALAGSASDVKIILLDAGSPVATVTLALPTARSLATDLMTALSRFEQMTGSQVAGIKELTEKLQQK